MCKFLPASRHRKYSNTADVIVVVIAVFPQGDLFPAEIFPKQKLRFLLALYSLSHRPPTSPACHSFICNIPSQSREANWTKTKDIDKEISPKGEKIRLGTDAGGFRPSVVEKGLYFDRPSSADACLGHHNAAIYTGSMTTTAMTRSRARGASSASWLLSVFIIAAAAFLISGR